MIEFTLHTEESSPEASKPLLAGSMKTYAMMRACTRLWPKRLGFSKPTRQ